MSAEKVQSPPTMADVLAAAQAVHRAGQQFNRLEIAHSRPLIDGTDEKEASEKKRKNTYYIIKPQDTIEPIELYAQLVYSNDYAAYGDRSVVKSRKVTAAKPFKAGFYIARTSQHRGAELTYFGSSRTVGEDDEGEYAREAWELTVGGNLLNSVEIIEKLKGQAKELSHFVGSQLLPETVESVLA